MGKGEKRRGEGGEESSKGKSKGKGMEWEKKVRRRKGKRDIKGEVNHKAPRKGES